MELLSRVMLMVYKAGKHMSLPILSNLFLERKILARYVIFEFIFLIRSSLLIGLLSLGHVQPCAVR